MKSLCLVAAACMLFSCAPKKTTDEPSASPAPNPYEERHRPAYHFSPAINWTNDPNGLVYYDGEYHLFYQYNPFANVWGHMSWGHAVSRDLLHWQHLPVAIAEYTDKTTGDSTMIFSGSAVADVHNTSGFFPADSGGLVAIYTSHLHANGQQITQHQSIAYSADRGRTFTRYENNPVLDIKRKDFRDPKVIWYEPEKKWVMTVVIPDDFKAQFYESKNLKEWKLLSTFGPLGDTAKIWECPDLIPLPVAGAPGKTKWVLLISNSHPQGPAYVGMQYFVGSFDGKKFTPDNPSQYPLYLEYGKDFYAAVTFNHVPDGRVILLGWANNWAYGQTIPTRPWRSAMTLPRELSLQNTPKGYRLFQTPIHEVRSLRADSVDVASIGNASPSQTFEIVYELKTGTAKRAGLKLTTGDNEATIIGYDNETHEVFVDRTRSGTLAFNAAFPSVERAPAMPQHGVVKLHVFVDRSLVEVFVNDGEQAITDQVFPTGATYRIDTFSEGGDAKAEMRVWLLKSVWNE